MKTATSHATSPRHFTFDIKLSDQSYHYGVLAKNLPTEPDIAVIGAENKR